MRRMKTDAEIQALVPSAKIYQHVITLVGQSINSKYIKLFITIFNSSSDKIFSTTYALSDILAKLQSIYGYNTISATGYFDSTANKIITSFQAAVSGLSVYYLGTANPTTGTFASITASSCSEYVFEM